MSSFEGPTDQAEEIMDLRVRIKVHGLGGTIGEHLRIIKEAFERIGAPVEVVDECPEKERELNRIADIRREAMVKRGVVVVAQHELWPG